MIAIITTLIFIFEYFIDSQTNQIKYGKYRIAEVILPGEYMLYTTVDVKWNMAFENIKKLNQIMAKISVVLLQKKETIRATNIVIKSTLKLTFKNSSCVAKKLVTV